ncbi:hypothetical protein FACS189437_00640 [Bacteroidia bacterium]|nr:hypothetical protein FACS189437_00640 [Bacteroidia bacterium]
MSYVNLLIHAVIRTKASEQTLPTDDRVKFLYQEMWGIIKNKGGYLYRINSMPDHVHVHGVKDMPHYPKVWKINRR